jgi:hypothetical protein
MAVIYVDGVSFPGLGRAFKLPPSTCTENSIWSYTMREVDIYCLNGCDTSSEVICRLHM